MKLTNQQKQEHLRWLSELTAIPTAAGRELRVIEWVRAWVEARRNLILKKDRAGNLLITMKPRKAPKRKKPVRKPRPLWITAHLDHPAFVIRNVIDPQTLELEFRGGVHDPYFENAELEILDAGGRPHRGVIEQLNPRSKPFKTVIAKLDMPSYSLQPGDIARWSFEASASEPPPAGDVDTIDLSGDPESARGDRAGAEEVVEVAEGAEDVGSATAVAERVVAALEARIDAPRPLPRIEDDLFHAHACDDLAAVAAALAVIDVLREDSLKFGHVGVLLTRAEEIGFIGAIAACKNKSIAKNARLICLENSRGYASDSPIGAGPIVRVGDKSSVFGPDLTNAISAVVSEYNKSKPGFKWQRKLMPGGTCEATTFSAFGFESTCLCLPLGNYHNMADIDGVLAGNRPARIAPEFISVSDYQGLVEMLLICARHLDAHEKAPKPLIDRMNDLYRAHARVLEE